MSYDRNATDPLDPAADPATPARPRASIVTRGWVRSIWPWLEVVGVLALVALLGGAVGILLGLPLLGLAR